MANEIEQNNLSFGIQDTMEMGMGNSDLLEDLIAPETTTADPDKVKDIKTADAEEAAEAQKTANAKKTKNKDKEDDDDGDNDDTLNDFLAQAEEEEEEEEDDDVAKQTISKKETKDKDPEEEEPQSGTQFEALTNDLMEIGVFSPAEEGAEPITTPEAFLEKFNAEKKQGAMDMVDNFLGQYGEDFREAFDSIFVKGINPREYYQAKNKIDSFTELDLSKEDNQISVIRQTLSDQGFDPEDVDSEVQRLKDYGDLEPVSQKYHKVLIKKESKALVEKTKQAEQVQQQKAQIREQYTNNVNTVLQAKIKEKEFDGIPLNPRIANELQDFLLVDKWKTDSGETLTDFDRYILDLKRPENHETKVKVGLLLKLLEKDPTLSTIQKSGVSKKTNTLFKEVSRQVAKTPSNKAPSKRSWFK